MRLILAAVSFSWLMTVGLGASRDFRLITTTPATVDNDGTHFSRPDLRQFQVASNYAAGYYRSWSTWSWLTTTDARKFRVFTCISSTSLTTARTWISVYDYQTGETVSDCNAGNASFDTNVLHNVGPHLTVASPAADNYSQMNAVSSLPGANLDLNFFPYGPNLYHAGSGRYQPILGGWTQQYTAPNMGVEGWLEVKGERLTIDKGKSVGWYDRQIDRDVALGGWELFYIYLSNGVRIAAWHTTPLRGESERNIVTVWYPTGLHSVVQINNDTKAAGGYRSPHNNILYHSEWELQIIDPPARLHIKALKQDNEIVSSANSTNPLNALWEGACEGSGVFNGEEVDFWCNAEQYFGYTAAGAA